LFEWWRPPFYGEKTFNRNIHSGPEMEVNRPVQERAWVLNPVCILFFLLLSSIITALFRVRVGKCDQPIKIRKPKKIFQPNRKVKSKRYKNK
jgi:hypothetical protein